MRIYQSNGGQALVKICLFTRLPKSRIRERTDANEVCTMVVWWYGYYWFVLLS